MKAGMMGRAALVALAIGSLWSSDSGATPRPVAAFQSVANLAAYWPLDESSGTSAADASGNGHTGYYSGGVSSSTTVAPLPVAGNLRSAQFDGTTGTIDVTNTAGLAFTGPFTLSAWVRPTSTPDHQMGIIEFFDDPGTGFINGYFLRLGKVGNPATGHYLKLNVGDGTAQPEAAQPGVALPLNQWTHVAGVFNGSTIEIFKNGSSVGSALASSVTASTSTLAIGGGTPNVFAGQIDEARIYNRDLSSTEIGVLFNGQPAPTNLIATPGPAQITLSWTAAAGAASYNIYRSTGGGFTFIGNTASTSYLDTGVANPTTYSYQVTALSVLESAPLGPVSAVPLPTLPKTVSSRESTNLAHRCGCDSIAQPVGLAALGMAALLALAGGLLRRN